MIQQLVLLILLLLVKLDEVPTAPGLFADTEPNSEEFQGVYNVRLTKEIIINPVAVNTQPIRFYTQPQISVTERRLVLWREQILCFYTDFSILLKVFQQMVFIKEFGTEEPKQGALAETSTKIIQSKERLANLVE